MSANAAALTDCLIRERQPLLRFLGRYLDTSTAEDVYQTLFLRLSSVPVEPPIRDALGYLYRMAYRLMLDWSRNAARYQDMLARAARLEAGADTPDVASTVETQIELQHAIHAVQALPQPTRNIFALHVDQALSERDIAAHLRISRTTVTKHIRRAMDIVSRARGGLCIALLVALLLPVLFLARGPAPYRETGANIARFTLPDGSRVVLDAGSAIDVAFTDTRRDVTLRRGRAWFEVKHRTDRPFRVGALGGTVEDVGTAFEVAIDDGVVHAAVTQGAVVVSGRTGGASRILLAGQSLRYDGDGRFSHIEDMSLADIATWRTGDLVLRDTPAREAIARVATYRRGPVWVVGSLADRRPVSALFRTDRPDEALALIARQMQLDRYDLPGGIVLLKPRKHTHD